MRPVGDTNISDAITSVEIAEYVRHHIDDFEESDFYINDPESLDILGDTFQSGDIDPILKDLMDQVDIETLQRILRENYQEIICYEKNESKARVFPDHA